MSLQPTDRKLDEVVNTVLSTVVAVVLIEHIFGKEEKNERPRHKPKGKWRYRR